MKAVIQLVSAFICIVLGATSCQSTKQSTYDYDYINITKQGVIQRPVMADFDVKKDKQSESGTFKNTTLAEARHSILKQFVKNTNCDVVVQPQYDTEAEEGMGKQTVTITLTGFAASYKNMRNYEPREKDLLLAKEYVIGPDEPVSLSAGDEQPKKKKSGVGKAIGIGLIVGALTALGSM